jgi:hypothetical protein
MKVIEGDSGILRLSPEIKDDLGTLEEKGVTRSVLKNKLKGPVSPPAVVSVSVMLIAIFYIIILYVYTMKKFFIRQLISVLI